MIARYDIVNDRLVVTNTDEKKLVQSELPEDCIKEIIYFFVDLNTDEPEEVPGHSAEDALQVRTWISEQLGLEMTPSQVEYMTAMLMSGAFDPRPAKRG